MHQTVEKPKPTSDMKYEILVGEWRRPYLVGRIFLHKKLNNPGSGSVLT